MSEKTIDFRAIKIQEEDIELRVQKINKSGYADLLLYKDARYDQRILDEHVGPLDWKVEYKEINGVVFCGISIFRAHSNEWVTKWNIGNQESKNEKFKTIASDGFKRAGFTWGIGVELYDLKAISVKLQEDEFREENGRMQPSYKLDLKKWSVKLNRGQNGKIESVEILDDKGNIRNAAGVRKPSGGEVKANSGVSSGPVSTSVVEGGSVNTTPTEKKTVTTSSEWLNADSDKWKEAEKFLESGGDLAKILSKYKVSKPDKAKLEEIVNRVKEEKEKQA